MADITVTAAQVGSVYPNGIAGTIILDMKAAEAITKGQAVYQTTSATAGIADANASGKQQFRGIALEDAASGEVVPVLVQGMVYGFSVSSLNGDVLLYLSDTAGSLNDTAGTMTVQVGRVWGLPDATKAVFIATELNRAWS